MDIIMKTTRTYDMRGRAAEADRTRARILDAAVALAGEVPLAACTLPAIADRAGVSVQTVLRAYGSRDGLFTAATTRAREQVVAQRATPVGDADAALDVLAEHYEAWGDTMLLLLAQESWEPVAAEITATGKLLHRDWVRSVFAPALDPLDAADRDQAVDLLVVATDLYAWKLLRRDRGLDRAATRERMYRLVASVLADIMEGERA
ncbi:TetR/AcrR family transcriptional regulator [Agromyces mariniharenae]|uniref:TetR/AcrR family transcriptional regulator n=2 Tax=Agromyces mariniharenae TaxID=2604423 RepID=A0A5S4V2C4_9MICO|nr:TetR/AcrR family transcriptional regulator [Agromyces mariniharenae]